MLLAILVLGSISAVFIASLVKWWYMKRYYFDTGVGVKYNGLKMLPLAGNALQFCFQPHSEYLDIAAKHCNANNGVLMLSFGFMYAVFITDYKLTEFIMSSNTITKKAEVYGFIKNWLGTGLLISHGEKWRNRRKMITPAFHYQILETFLETFQTSTNTLIEVLTKEMNNSNSNIVDIHNPIAHCTLDVICEAAMGITLNAQIEKDSEYVKTVKAISKIFLERLVSPLKLYHALYQYSSTYRREKKFIEYLHNHTYTIIRSRRKELLEKGHNNTKTNKDEAGVKNRKAFLDILLESTIDNQPLSDEDIREEVDTFMFEGHDTTASALCFALFSIAENPEVQEKILLEQKIIFGENKNRAATYNELNNMKYLELVLKETMRLYPSVPAVGREVTEDFEYNGVKFKKGLQLGVFIYGLHRNPENFRDPDKFIPERFSPENNTESKPYAYIPFSAGPRNCIGQKFAMLEMKTTISKVIRYFELRAVVPKHELQLVPETILRCGNGFPIQFVHRNFGTDMV